MNFILLASLPRPLNLRSLPLHVTLDSDRAEWRFLQDPRSDDDAAILFDRSRAHALLDTERVTHGPLIRGAPSSRAPAF